MLKSKLKYIISLLVLFINSLCLFSQERGLLLSKYYSPKDYNASSQNWSIVQDNRGIMYFGNASCILEYDGIDWRKIYVPNNSTIRTLAVDGKNNIYAGAYEELGQLLPDKTGNLKYHSLNHLIDSSCSKFGDIWDVNCINEDVFFLSDDYLFRYKDQKIVSWAKTKERFYLSHKVNSDFYIQEIGKGLLKFENDSLILINKGDFFADIRIHSILPIDNKLLICTRTKGLYIYDNTKKNVHITPFSKISDKAQKLNDYFLKNTFYHGINISDSLFAMGTVSGNVLIVNKDWDVVDIINEETTGVVSSAQYLYLDKDQNLWLALANGISQIDILSPFRFWNNDKGINGNISDVASLDDNLYVSTVSGVYYTSRKSDNTNYTINNFSPVKGNFEQAWGFLYFILPDANFKTTEELLNNENKYFSPTSDKIQLLAASSTGLFQIDEDRSIKISDYNSIFEIYQYKKDPSQIFLGLSNGIAHMSYSKGKWIDHGMKFDITDQIRGIYEDSIGNLWASARYRGIYKIQNPKSASSKNTIQLFNEKDGLPSVQSVQITNFENELVFISANNLFKFNNSTNSFTEFSVPKQEEVNTTEYYDTLSWYKIYKNVTSLYYVTTFADSSEWFSTVDGNYRFCNTYRKDYFNILPAIIRNVTSGDSIIFNGTNYKSNQDTSNRLQINSDALVDVGTILEFKDNSLVFNYSLPFYEDESRNEYSYYLEGNDKEWSPWTTETKKEYTNLKEGDYVYKVKSRNLYMLESPASGFKFTILAPWYRSFAAVLGYIMIGILLIIAIVRLYTYRLIREKEKLEEIVIERTQEILMQKEEILVQAEHLKDANERISGKNEELEKQKWEITNQAVKLKKANVELIKLSKVASETDNAITVFDKDGNLEWINDGFTRMYGYTYDQYVKEKNINIINGSDNPNIQDAVKSCINDKKSVAYQFKTKTREGKEIWAQTTLTHVIDKNGETINLIAIDSDISKIKLAEKEILNQKHEIEEHRDKLAVSNATKNKFFRIIAHDLRNPISTLAVSTDLIFNEFNEFNDEQTRNVIGEINKLSQTTFNLLENLLDWSSTQMGEIKFSPKPIDIFSLTKESIELTKRKVDSKKIKLSIDVKEETFAFADENMIKTVIRNIISNAVKFTPENGIIKISCSNENEFIKYSVEDSGIGISKEDQKKLFKIDTHHTTPGLLNEKGSGLGLILCKEFIDKNSGEINISSKPQKGTKIEFTLKKHSV